MTPLFQVAATLVAEIRTLVDDIERGFVLGGVAGAIVVVLRRARLSPDKYLLVAARLTLFLTVIFLLVIVALK